MKEREGRGEGNKEEGWEEMEGKWKERGEKKKRRGGKGRKLQNHLHDNLNTGVCPAGIRLVTKQLLKNDRFISREIMAGASCG